MTFVFLVTAFLSAALLFFVQPMIGKMILPLLGGAPSVWNTCLVFFQAVVLLGYTYAHFATRWLGERRQAFAHIGLMLLPLAVLPMKLSDQAVASVPHEGNPIPWLLGFLALTAGLPLFVVSASAPLLQKWFAGTRNPRARDPYFLYAASNAGSMLGLLGYPVLLEPMLRVRQQTWLWAAGYGALLLLMAGCAIAATRSEASVTGDATPAQNTNDKVTARRRLRWVVLAFAPSSLMMGVTTYLTTDIAPLPLFWVIPLALYLTTFILVFARRPLLPTSRLGRVLCLPALVLIIAFVVEANQPPWLLISLHLIVFFAAAWICHGELAKDRPSPAHLTVFYLCLSLGGVLGGIFNALLAPQIFSRVLEYPLAMVLVCMIRPSVATPGTARSAGWRDALWPVTILALTAGLIVIVQRPGHMPSPHDTLWIFAVPALLTYRLVQRPVPYGLGLAAILVASVWYTSAHGRRLCIERNFFGVLRVTVDPTGEYRQLVHGNTVHGRESIDPKRRSEPLVYFHRLGPAGDVFKAFNASPVSPYVGVIGLGAGSMASYAKPTQDWTFYEIDPAVEHIARDPRYFTFLSDSAARTLQVALGDARLRLREAPDGQYGLIALDAFSSDSIPMHLVTREALQLYLRKLHDGGLLAFHVSNRRLDLRPALANLAGDAGLVCAGRRDFDLTPEERADGREPSEWIVMARRREDLHGIESDLRWERLDAARRGSVWTDDFSNIFSALRWR